MHLLADQPLERALQRRAGDAVALGGARAGRRLAVGERGETARSARRSPSQTAWWTSRVSSSARSSASAAGSGRVVAAVGQVEEVRGEQHRPLRVAVAEGDDPPHVVGVEPTSSSAARRRMSATASSAGSGGSSSGRAWPKNGRSRSLNSARISDGVLPA